VKPKIVIKTKVWKPTELLERIERRGAPGMLPIRIEEDLKNDVIVALQGIPVAHWVRQMMRAYLLHEKLKDGMNGTYLDVLREEQEKSGTYLSRQKAARTPKGRPSWAGMFDKNGDGSEGAER
jgi:hypothetical protein